MKFQTATTRTRLFALIASLCVCAVMTTGVSAQSRPGTTTSPQTQNPQTAPPAGTTPQQGRPGALPPGQTELPPNAGTSPITPTGEAQQSAQPSSTIQQQRQQTAPNTSGPQPITPQIQTPGQTSPTGGLPSTAAPAGTATGDAAGAAGGASTGATTGTPGQNVGVSAGVAPAELPQEPPAIAPGYEAPVRPLPSAERVGVNLDEQTPLTLDDAIRLAVENNNDLDSARIDVRLAEFDLTGARGAYDPIFSSESFYERSTTPTSSVIGGGANGSVTQTNATGAARFGGFSPFGGGSYQADFSSTRITTNNSFVSLNPQFPSALTLTYTQPLLRGRGFDQRRRLVEINKRNLSLTDAQFRQRAIDVVTQVESAYWDLAFSLRNLQVQIDAVKQARIQVESNRRLVAGGVLAPIDLVAADAQVTTFEQNVYTAQESVTRNENALKTLLLASRANPLWSRPIVPVTPVNLEPPRAPLEEAVASAITNRPELAQIETNSEINRINQRFFREQTRPQIDLVGTYNPVGLAGTAVTRATDPLGTDSDTMLQDRVNELSRRAGLEPLPTIPTTTRTVNENLVGGYGQSLGNLIGLNYPSVRVGVRVEIPFRNRTAQANFGRALAEGTQIENLRRQTEQLIEADVRNSLQAVRSAEARLASAASARSSAEQQDASERRQFAAGTSTLFLVFQRQTELLAARGRELQAQTDLNKSIALLERATGTTLTANNVALRLDDKRTPQRGRDDAEVAGFPVAAKPLDKPPVSLISVIGENPAKRNVVTIAAEPTPQTKIETRQENRDAIASPTKSIISFDNISTSDSLTTKAAATAPTP